MRSFVKIKSSRNGGITLSFTDEGKSCQSLISTPQICLLTLMKNKILAEISEFTVGHNMRKPVFLVRPGKSQTKMLSYID